MLSLVLSPTCALMWWGVWGGGLLCGRGDEGEQKGSACSPSTPCAIRAAVGLPAPRGAAGALGGGFSQPVSAGCCSPELLAVPCACP